MPTNILYLSTNKKGGEKMKKVFQVTGLIVVTVLLFASCKITQQVVLSNLPGDATTSPVATVRGMAIKSPVKNQQVFTYADIAPLTSTYFTSNIVVHRADFRYYLENDSEPFFRTGLNKVFNSDYNSPYSCDINADFKYFVAERNFINNIISIYMSITISISDNNEEILNKTFEVVNNEKYSTAWVTYPRNKTMNSLFNKALNSCVNLIMNDPEIKSINQ
jgi:hypothetical protein